MNDNDPVMGSLMRMQAMWDRVANGYLEIGKTLEEIAVLVEDNKNKVLEQLALKRGE